MYETKWNFNDSNNNDNMWNEPRHQDNNMDMGTQAVEAGDDVQKKKKENRMKQDNKGNANDYTNILHVCVHGCVLVCLCVCKYVSWSFHRFIFF